MFAVIKAGGKQYRVTPEDVIRIDRVKGEPGEIVEFGEVLVLGAGPDRLLSVGLFCVCKGLTALSKTRGPNGPRFPFHMRGKPRSVKETAGSAPGPGRPRSGLGPRRRRDRGGPGAVLGLRRLRQPVTDAELGHQDAR